MVSDWCQANSETLENKGDVDKYEIRYSKITSIFITQCKAHKSA